MLFLLRSSKYGISDFFFHWVFCKVFCSFVDTEAFSSTIKEIGWLLSFNLCSSFFSIELRYFRPFGVYYPKWSCSFWEIFLFTRDLDVMIVSFRSEIGWPFWNQMSRKILLLSETLMMFEMCSKNKRYVFLKKERQKIYVNIKLFSSV